MQRRTLGTREALEGILEDAATPTRAFASDYGYDLVSLLLPGDECSYVMATRRSSAISSTRSRSRMIWNWCAARPEARWIMWLDGILKLLISLTGIPPRNSRSYPRIASHKASTSRPAIQACGRTRVAYPVRSPYVLLGRSDYGQCERAYRHCRIRQRHKRSCVV